MNVKTVKECSLQLKTLLDEQHNALDARVKSQIEEVIGKLDAVEAEASASNRLAALLSIVNLLRTATSIVDLISKIRND
jgi:hypothetical protein